MCNIFGKGQSQALSSPLPMVGNRYTQKDGGMVAVVRALNGDRVVFSYEQHPNASHDYSLEAFTHEFTRLGCVVSNLKTHNEVTQRLNAVIDSANVIEGDAPAVRTHNRLMHIQAISSHLISDVIPNIADVSARNAVYMWLDAIHTITQIEEHEAQGVTHG